MPAERNDRNDRAEIEVREPLAIPVMDPTRRTDEAPWMATAGSEATEEPRMGAIGSEAAEEHGPPAALLVCHGMGQQIRFETLEQLARRLVHPQHRRVGIRRVTIGSAGNEHYRVELTMADRDGNPRAVHLYESYWAPITEGKIGIRDVLVFLLRAAWNGYRHTRGDCFRRWMFGNVWDLPIKAASTRIRLAAAALTVLSLIAIHMLVLLVTFSRVFTGSLGGWPDMAFLRMLFWGLAALTVVLAVPGLMLAIVMRLRRKEDPRRHPATRMALFAAVGGTIGVGVFLAVAAFLTAIRTLDPWFASWPPLGNGMRVGLVVLWGVTLAITGALRFFLIQYVGDVAAYVSANWVDKFSEIRRDIQKISWDVARSVYTAREGERFLYDDIVMIGHSLGSVVAYDTLNSMIREDQTATTHFHAAHRTRALVTFGSPLNKTAFIFGTQLQEGDEIREALANAVQPLIQDYRFRPDQWINLYSPEDWIGGKIEFYDKPAAAKGDGAPEGETQEGTDPDEERKRVQDVVDEYATTPVAAHTEHWDSPALRRVLSRALPPAGARRDPGSIPDAESRPWVASANRSRGSNSSG